MTTPKTRAEIEARIAELDRRVLDHMRHNQPKLAEIDRCELDLLRAQLATLDESAPDVEHPTPLTPAELEEMTVRLSNLRAGRSDRVRGEALSYMAGNEWFDTIEDEGYLPPEAVRFFERSADDVTRLLEAYQALHRRSFNSDTHLREQNKRLNIERRGAQDALEEKIFEYETGYGYLRRLFESCAPQCEPFGDLLGLATQIDNYIAGQKEDIARLTAEVESLSAQLDVSKSEWRAEHKRAERLTAELAEAKADLLTVARAAGIVYEGDGHADAPGPAEAIAESVKEDRREVARLTDALDAANAELERVRRERDVHRRGRIEAESFTRVIGSTHFKIFGLDPGIEAFVQKLRNLGFETTDSGDGVSKPAEQYASGEALRFPHVAAVTTPDQLVSESHRMQDALMEPWKVEASYSPTDGTALLFAFIPQETPAND